MTTNANTDHLRQLLTGHLQHLLAQEEILAQSPNDVILRLQIDTTRSELNQCAEQLRLGTLPAALRAIVEAVGLRTETIDSLCRQRQHVVAYQRTIELQKLNALSTDKATFTVLLQQAAECLTTIDQQLAELQRGHPALVTQAPPPPPARDDDDLAIDYTGEPWYVQGLPTTMRIDKQHLPTLRADNDIVVMTATEIELWSVLHLLKPYPGYSDIVLCYDGSETYYLGMFGTYRAVVTRCEAGSTDSDAATLATRDAIQRWTPCAVIMVGIAFGADRTKQHMGDVLVAKHLFCYEPQRLGAETTIPRGSQTKSNDLLFNRFRNPPNWRFERPDGSVCRVHYGLILTGEKLVDNAGEKAELLKMRPEAIGGEMEGAGFSAAAERSNVPWIVVKAICDWGDGTKQSKHQSLAAAAATSLTHHILSQEDVLQGLSKPPSDRDSPP